MDRFPEAFSRFEVVDVKRIESSRQLRLAFAYWAGWKWHDTYMQNRALAVEARRLGIPVFVERRPFVRFHERTAVTWRHEVVTVKDKSQTRYRDLLRQGASLRSPNEWKQSLSRKFVSGNLYEKALIAETGLFIIGNSDG